MPSSGISFKTRGHQRGRTPRRRPDPPPKKFAIADSAMEVTVLPPPVKPDSDKKTYKVIKLENGLVACLVSDPRPAAEEDTIESSGSETDCSESEGSESDDDVESPKSGPQEDDKVAACALCIGVGSYSDPQQIQGMAHFVEHMVFMGSQKYPVENDFDAFIRKKGGSDNAMTDCETTTFYFEVQTNHFAEGMDRFAQFFVAPLMKQEAMQRERESIESEFSLALPSDGNRREQILSSLLTPGHPGRTFMWGNTRSLTPPYGPADSELYERAHDFRKRHYSAHRMTVAVQARLPIETLEKYVKNTFGQIPSNDLPPDDFSQYEYSPKIVSPEFHAVYYVKPMMQTINLTMTWCMRSYMKDFKAKPHKYVGWIIGHEGTGSLLLYLQKKVWALGIYCGISDGGIDHTSLLSFFSISVVLTQEGLRCLDQVVDAVFSYIAMLKKHCPDERIFNEVQKIEQVNFKFKDEQHPYEHVEDLSQNMQYLPSEYYISGVDMFFEYDPKSIREVIDAMSPDTVNFMIQSQQYPQPIDYDQIEEWFGTEYKRENIPGESIRRWTNIEPYPEFHLPEPNVFIPDDFALIPPLNPPVLIDVNGDVEKGVTQVGPITCPVLIRKDDSMEVWHKPDYKFNLPNTFVYMYFITSLSIESPKTACLLDLWCSVLNQLLTEKLYAADVTGINRSITNEERGIIVKVNGFSQKVGVVVEEIMDTFKNYNQRMNPEFFNALKDIQTKSYMNFLMKPNKLVKEMRLTIIMDIFWPTLEKLESLRSLTYEDMIKFGETFTDKLYVKMLMQGNLLKDDALKIADLVKDRLKWNNMTEEEIPKVFVCEIPLGEKYCRILSFNKDDENSIVTNYYQFGVGSINHNCIVELLTLLIEEPLFDTLRTKEQLGYNVFCMMRYTSGILGFSVTVNVQAGKYGTGYVDERIEEFLKDFHKNLHLMNQETFEQSRTGLIKLKNYVDVELKDEINRNWDEIVNNEYQFDRQSLETECIKKLELSDVIEWLDNNLKHGNRRNFRKLSVQIAGHEQKKGDKHIEKKAKFDNFQYIMEEYEFCMKFMEGTDSPHYIKDLAEFKRSLEKFPERKSPIAEKRS